MKRLITASLILLSIATTAQDKATGTPISVDALQEEMLTKTKDVHTISCDFVQNKHMEYLDAVITSKGILSFDKSSRLRWEYQDPFSYLITINNGKFTIDSDGNVKEYDIKTNKVFSQVSELIIKSINGTIFTDDAFVVEAFKEGDDYIIYAEPTLKEMKTVLSKIVMTIDSSDFSVNKVLMYEQEDSYTELIFTNKRFNEVLPATYFDAK